MSDPWHEHEIERQRAWLALTPAQRLAWLEGMQRFARAALRAAADRGVRVAEVNDPCWLPPEEGDPPP